MLDEEFVVNAHVDDRDEDGHRDRPGPIERRAADVRKIFSGASAPAAEIAEKENFQRDQRRKKSDARRFC